MNEQHFICQLCKDKKNIIFYKEIAQLLEHYRSLHHVCPYQECLEDMFVVFDSEEKLNSHLFTKHKCVDAQNRIASFHFDEKKRESAKYSKGSKSYIRDEFNFTEYVNQLKDKVKDYIKNFSSRKKSDEYNNEYNNQYSNQYNNEFSYQERKGRQHNKNKKKEAYYGYEEQHGQGYENEYQSGYYDNNNYQSSARRGKNNNNKFNQNQDYMYYENTPSSHPNKHTDVFDQALYTKSETFIPKDKRAGKGPNQNYSSSSYNNNYRENHPEHQNSQANAPTHNSRSKQPIANNPIKIDYSFIFNSVVKIVKEYIATKIKSENPAEEEFLLPHEIIYQLIVIIDKLDQEKLLELNSLNNFGIDLEVFKEMKKLLSQATLDGKFTDSFKKLLDKLEIRKLLICYKYLTTAQKKIDGLFYKLDYDQIDQDLYDDFVSRPQKNKRKVKHHPKEKDFKPASEGKIKLNNNFPNLIGMKESESKQKKVENKGRLDFIFEKKCAVSEVEPIETKTEDKIDNQTSKTVGKGNKLTTFFNEPSIPQGKIVDKSWTKKKFTKSKMNYDDEFPEL